MGNMALYTVIDRETNKTVCVNKTSRVKCYTNVVTVVANKI